MRDGLTGLYNHRYLQEALEAELVRAARYGQTGGRLFIDVDHFTAYTDREGHPAGDRVLKRLAAVLTGGSEGGSPQQGRASDVATRYGGEEFVIILPQTDLRGSIAKAERVRQAVCDFAFDGAKRQPMGCISVSIGVAVYPAHAKDKQGLISAADRALYRAKDAGRNCVAAADGYLTQRDAS